MFVCVAFLLLILCALGSEAVLVCRNSGNQIAKVLNFDDVVFTGYLVALEQPYNGFIFERVSNGDFGYPDSHVPVINTSYPDEGITTYYNVATSKPNIIITTGESFSMKLVNPQPTSSRPAPLFAIGSLRLTSIFQSGLVMFINTTKQGVVVSSTTVTLTYQETQLVTIDQSDVDRLIIGCVTPTLASCNNVAYDDISVCYKLK